MKFWPMTKPANGALPLELRRTKNVEVEDASAALAVAEYSSVRQESLQSFATSQSILQWSLATYGVLFGAGLLAASNDVAEDLSSTVSWMAAIIYGLLLPGLVCAASWAWIGEIRRMERAGVYLRGVERRISEETRRSSSSVIAPLHWESFLAGDSRQEGPPVKGWAPYLGTALLFGGGFLSSVMFMYFWVDRILNVEGEGGGAGVWILIGANTVLLVLFFGVCLHTGLGVVTLGEMYFDFATGKLQWIRRRSRHRLREAIVMSLVFLALGALGYWLLPESVLIWR